MPTKGIWSLNVSTKWTNWSKRFTILAEEILGELTEWGPDFQELQAESSVSEVHILPRCELLQMLRYDMGMETRPPQCPASPSIA